MKADRLAEHLGQACAERLIRAAAGRRIWVPRCGPPILGVALDMHDMARICAHFGGGYLYVPRDPRQSRHTQRNREIRALRRRGTLIREIARQYGLSEARVYQIIAGAQIS